MKHKRKLTENANEYLEMIFIDKKEPKINAEYLSNLFLISHRQKKKPRNIALRIQTRGFSLRVIHFDH